MDLLKNQYGNPLGPPTLVTKITAKLVTNTKTSEAATTIMVKELTLTFLPRGDTCYCQPTLKHSSNSHHPFTRHQNAPNTLSLIPHPHSHITQQRHRRKTNTIQIKLNSTQIEQEQKHFTHQIHSLTRHIHKKIKISYVFSPCTIYQHT